MFLQIASISVSTGIAKASGNPFRMFRASVLMPFQDRNSANYQSHGFGLSAVEISVSDTAYDSLNQYMSTQEYFPVGVDVDTNIDGEGRLMITGFNPPLSGVASPSVSTVADPVTEDKGYFASKAK